MAVLRLSGGNADSLKRLSPQLYSLQSSRPKLPKQHPRGRTATTGRNGAILRKAVQSWKRELPLPVAAEATAR